MLMYIGIFLIIFITFISLLRLPSWFFQDRTRNLIRNLYYRIPNQKDYLWLREYILNTTKILKEIRPSNLKQHTIYQTQPNTIYDYDIEEYKENLYRIFLFQYYFGSWSGILYSIFNLEDIINLYYYKTAPNKIQQELLKQIASFVESKTNYSEFQF